MVSSRLNAARALSMDLAISLGIPVGILARGGGHSDSHSARGSTIRPRVVVPVTLATSFRWTRMGETIRAICNGCQRHSTRIGRSGVFGHRARPGEGVGGGWRCGIVRTPTVPPARRRPGGVRLETAGAASRHLARVVGTHA
jgi:hypothetical protein